jgi:hypothetical protein
MQLTINKVAAGVVGIAMVAGLMFAFTATRAHAITLSELVELFIALEVIPEDKADEARAVLDNQDEETPAMMSCEFTRDLSQGDTGADVMDLQELLNANGFTVAVSGAGSPGMETEYYGPATAGAVAAMQEAFAADILTPLGLTAGTGYFGASTRAKANTLCSSDTPDVPDLPGDEDDDMDDEELGGDEASLEDYDRMGSPSGVDVQEGDEEVKVAGFEFDVEDGDVSIRRVDVEFEQTSLGAGASEEPWDYFEAIQLYINGDMVAEENADDEDDWDEDSNVFTMRFSGLSEKAMEDDSVEVVIGVTMLSNLDTDEEGETWNVRIPANGLRAIDGAGVDQYTGSASETRDFETEGAGTNDELQVSLDSSNPDSSIIKVETDDETEDVVILVFELEAEGNDIEVKEIPVFFTIGTANFNAVVADVKLEIDGEEYDDYTTVGAASTNATTTFDLSDDEPVIDEDGSVTVKVIVDLQETDNGSNYLEGETIKAELRGGAGQEVKNIDAEGGDDIAAGDISGSAIGEVHQLYTEGIFAEIVSTDETKTAGDNNSDDVGDYEIEFDLTAFDDTFYVSATSTGVITYQVENGSGSTVATTTTEALTSGASKEGDAYRIDSGDSETFTLTVNLDPDTDGFYRIQLVSIEYGSTAALPYGVTHTVSPEEDFETGLLNLNA